MTADVIEGTAVEVPSAVVIHHEPAEGTTMPALYEVGLMTDEEFERHVTMLTSGLRRIGQLQRSLLEEGEDRDYGQIKGVKRTVLFKSGAEKLCQFYRLVPEFRSHLEVTPSPSPDMPERLTVTVRTLLHHG